MAITKEVNIVVKEQGIESVTKKVDGLTNSTEELNKSQSKNKASAKLSTDAIKEIAPASTSAIQGLASMGKAMWAIVANPIGLILTAIVGTIALLVAAFRTFQPLVDKVEQGMAALGAVLNVVKNTFIAVVTGAKSLGSAFSGLGSEMSDAAKRTIALTKAQQDLEDAMKSQEVATAKQRAEISKLNVMAKNKNLTEKERLDLLNKAEKIEKNLFDKRVKLADEEVRQAREAIAIKAGFNSKEIALLKKTGDATKELAEKRGGNYDEEYDRLNKARIARIALEDEATSNLEKNYNKQDALQSKQDEARQKRIDEENAAREKEKAKQDKLREEEKAYEEDVLKNQQKMNLDRVNQEMQDAADEKERKQKNLDDISNTVDALEEDNSKRRQRELDAEKKATEEKIALENQVKDAKYDIANQTLGLISEIAGKGSKVAKAAAIAQATISGVQGVQNAFTTASASPVTALFPAYPFIQAGLAGAFSAVQIAKIAKGEKAGASSSSGGDGGRPSAPSFNLVQGTSSNQIASSINTQQPIQAYVVSKNVSTGLELDRNIIKSASL